MPTLDLRGVIDEDAAQAELVKIAAVVTETAKTIAPVGKVQTRGGQIELPGQYRDGLKVVVRGKKVYVSGTDYKSHWIEWGTNKWEGHATIRRAFALNGLRIREDPKR